MAHRPTQRRNLHPSQSNSNPSPSSSSLSSTVPISKHLKPRTKPTTTHHHPTPNPDLITQSFITSSRPNSNFTLHQHFSSLNLGPSKTRYSKQSQITKHSSLDDTRLHGKSMSASAIFDSSKKFSLLKPKLETECSSGGGGNTNKRSSKEKKQQSSKLHVLMKNEKDEIEKSRNRVCSEDDDGVGNNKRNCSSVSVSVSSSSPSTAVAPTSRIRRRSLCESSSAMVDLKDVFAINGVKMVSADMPPFMQIHAIDSARKAFDSMEKFTSKTLASSLKKEFDGVYGPAWHCIVGTSFGSFVTHSLGGFLYFSMDHKLYILLFKTPVQKVH